MSEESQFEIDVKRFYVPGLDPPCPKCGEAAGNRDYLSFPTANKPSPVSFYCFSCDKEWDAMVTVHVHVEIGEPIEKKEHEV